MDLSTLGRFHIAPGYDPSLPATWVWTDRSADVNHVNGGARITGGRGDETSQAEAGSALLEVDNAGGHYCTDNPLGRDYGLLSDGCPARWGTISGAEAFTAATSNGWGMPDVGIAWSLEGAASNWSSSSGMGRSSFSSANTAASAFLIGADARNGDATVVFSVPAVATGASLIAGMQVRWTSSSDHLFFVLDFGLSGVLTARIQRQTSGGLVSLASATLALTYTANQRIKIRCVWDGQDLRMRVWADGSGEPATWDVTATDSVCEGSVVSVRFWRLVGNTNTSPVVFAADDLEIEAVEITGTVPDWPIRWDDTAGQSWSPIEIAGPMRRLGQGGEDLRSPIYHQLAGQNPMGYWPLEDASGATTAASGVARGAPAVVTDGVFGNTDCPPGASSALTLNTGGVSRVAGRFRGWSIPLDGYAVMAYFRFPSLPASGSPVITQKILEIPSNGSITRWIIYATSTGFYVEGYQPDGTLLVNAGSFTYGINPLQWFALQLEAQESGGTVNWALIWHQVGSTAFSSGSGSFAGTADRVTAATAWAPVDGTIVSHLWFGDDLLPFVDSVFMKVSAGYAGELAADRIARLHREQGETILVEPGASEPLGVQKAGDFLGLVRDAEAADLGILYEAGAGMGYRPRGARYNRRADLALSIPGLDLGDPAPQPTKDDSRVRNYWTVSRVDGSSATDFDDADVKRRGRRPDQATINIQTDGPLGDHASWRVSLGTWGEYRWPQINLDLTDRPDLLAAWRGRRYAPRLTITGVPSQGPIGQDVSLTVEGWSQEINSDSWKVTLNCSPARPWDVGVWDNSAYRYDSRTTTLEVGLNPGDLLAGFITVDRGEFWSWTSAPYLVTISGQQNRVIGMSQPDSVAVVDGTFETSNTGAWAVTGGSLAASTVQAHRGTYSALLTVSGSPANALIRDHTTVTAAPGRTYTAKMWVYCSASRNVIAVIDYYNGASYLSSSSATVAVTANTWTELVVSGTAPASTTRLECGPTMDASPANGTLLYIDDLDILRTDVQSGRQLATLTRAINGITKALPVGAAVHVTNSGRWAL
jgi:hypothetical protein